MNIPLSAAAIITTNEMTPASKLTIRNVPDQFVRLFS